MTPEVNRICRVVRKLGVSDHSSEWTDDLAAKLEHMGHTVLGVGMFGVVVDFDEFVLKIFCAKDNAYLDFLDFCDNVDSKHLPIIYWDKQVNNYWWAVCLEKLEPLVEDCEGVCNEHTPHKFYVKTFKRSKGRKVNTGSKEMNALVDLLNEKREEEQHWPDLHNGNAMLRDRTLVITDPWCS